jgi:hypothetical protein
VPKPKPREGRRRTREEREQDELINTICWANYERLASRS